MGLKELLREVQAVREDHTVTTQHAWRYVRDCRDLESNLTLAIPKVSPTAGYRVSTDDVVMSASALGDAAKIAEIELCTTEIYLEEDGSFTDEDRLPFDADAEPYDVYDAISPTDALLSFVATNSVDRPLDLARGFGPLDAPWYSLMGKLLSEVRSGAKVYDVAAQIVTDMCINDAPIELHKDYALRLSLAFNANETTKKFKSADELRVDLRQQWYDQLFSKDLILARVCREQSYNILHVQRRLAGLYAKDAESYADLESGVREWHQGTMKYAAEFPSIEATEKVRRSKILLHSIVSNKRFLQKQYFKQE